MQISPSHRRAAVAALPFLLLSLAPAATAVAAPAVPNAPADLPTALSTSSATTALDGLTVARHESMAGYRRDRFPRWIPQGQDCNTREKVFLRDGRNVRRDEYCRAVSGAWTNPYDGTVITQPSQLEVDHVVPLTNAWQSGANTWTDAKRKAFANDLEAPQLLTTTKESRLAKDDQSPDEWRPPLRSYWCTYSRAWIDVKARYHLTVTPEEKTVLREMLGTCATDQ
ncbi:HNH endonuclease [Nonomuraea sp. NN258]|uniref:HNH endonuclease family protein n=1 Tax=Nonomuraea antri TaxID=2730852 RepID=UPI001567ED82|nr:HNH endonuclease family protein [Nonomuraea antri]NRQ33361.1 HNH endonuclease [Nonomuraea antri]